MRVPDSGAAGLDDIKKELPDQQSEFINNPVYGKEKLSRMQAFDVINQLTVELMLDEKERT
jgi:hypothetical protein